MLITKEKDHVETVPPARAAGRFSPRALLVTAGAIVAGWAVTLGAHALGADWLTAVLVLLGLMSLLRVGRTVFDRFVLALGVLIGLTCVAGLLFSVWPWHLDPVPVAGCSFTVLALAALALGRRPSLPLVGRFADLLAVAATTCCGILFTHPFWRGGFDHVVGWVLPGEDFARHYMIFDGIRHIGGYVFMNRAGAPFVIDGYVTYPQGSHLIFALLDRFAGTSPTASPLVAFEHLTLFFVGAYVFMCAAVIWAVRWVAGPAMRGWSGLPVLVLVATYLFFGNPIYLYLNGFPSEVVGLALLAILLAVTARPVGGVREQALVCGTLLVGISFTYYMWLPLAAVAVLAWLIVHRRRVRLRIPTIVVISVATAVFGLVMPLVNIRAANPAQLLLNGGAALVPRSELIALVALSLVGLGLRHVRRSLVWRVNGLQTLVALAVIVAIYAFQEIMLGTTIYYFEKALHQMMIVALIGLGSLVPVLRRAFPRPKLAGGRRWHTVRWQAGFLPSMALAVAVLVGVSGMPATGVPARKAVQGWAFFRDYGSQYYSGRVIANTYRLVPNGDGVATIVRGYGGYPDFWGTLYVSVLQRDYANTVNAYVFMFAYRHPHITTVQLENFIAAYPVPVRVVEASHGEGALLQEFGRQHPKLKLQVVWQHRPSKKY